MNKYFSFTKYFLKEQSSSLFDYICSAISFTVHVLILYQLFDFIIGNKIIDGFSMNDLVWYVIFGESFCYSFYNSYKNIAYDISNGTIAYNLSKPYNFMLRIISEQIALIPKTVIFLIIGTIIGLIIAGPINITWYNLLLSSIVYIFGLLVQMILHLIIGIMGIWLGKDVSSIWLILSKFSLILVFTPLDFFPKVIQIILRFLPTTHVTYTPSQLLVHFTYLNFINSIIYEIISIIGLSVICYIIYRKGVKKLNVEGI